MKKLLLILLAIPAFGQVGTFHAPVSVSVNGSSSTTLTIQQPASGAKTVSFITAIAGCGSNAFTLTQAYNGSAATNTSASVIAMMTTSTNTTNAALAFSASNVGAGTALPSIPQYSAGSIAVIDLTKPGASMTGNGTSKNYSLTLTNNGSGSCTAVLDIIWQER